MQRVLDDRAVTRKLRQRLADVTRRGHDIEQQRNAQISPIAVGEELKALIVEGRIGPGIDRLPR